MARVIWLKYKKRSSEQKNVSTKRAEAGTKIASNWIGSGNEQTIDQQKELVGPLASALTFNWIDDSKEDENFRNFWLCGRNLWTWVRTMLRRRPGRAHGFLHAALQHWTWSVVLLVLLFYSTRNYTRNSKLLSFWQGFAGGGVSLTTVRRRPRQRVVIVWRWRVGS